MKTVVAAVAAVFFLAAFTAPLKPTNNAGPKQVMYETDGHYWSVRLMSYLVLKDTSMARQLAYYAEWPDDIRDANGNFVKSRNTWLLPWRQAHWHALTGLGAKSARKTSMRRIRNAKTIKKKGINLHRLGDSFAHAMKKDKQMFPLFIGHALRMHSPDKIANFPAKYLVYVDSLCTALGGNPKTTDLTAFKYVADNKLDSPANMEILKSELYIQSKVPMYTIDIMQMDVVTNYLNSRKAAMGFNFTIEKVQVYTIENKDNGKSGDRQSKAVGYIARVTLTFNN